MRQFPAQTSGKTSHELVGGQSGQKPQFSQIHAEHRQLVGAQLFDGMQNRAVAAQHDRRNRRSPDCRSSRCSKSREHDLRVLLDQRPQPLGFGLHVGSLAVAQQQHAKRPIAGTAPGRSPAIRHRPRIRPDRSWLTRFVAASDSSPSGPQSALSAVGRPIRGRRGRCRARRAAGRPAVRPVRRAR